MFSFHKPRVYRSVTGCCICRAKSSSSRFTDSKRYEEDFYDCFKLDHKRSGEICNACVLLVKRWKKLPRGSGRNWKHVVDARAGHGSKPMSKIKKVKKSAAVKDAEEENTEKKEFLISEVMPTRTAPQRETSPSGFSDDVQYCVSSGSGSYDSSLTASPLPSPEQMAGVDVENGVQNSTAQENTPVKRMKGRFKRIPRKNVSINSSFLDLDFWKREKTCCGIIFKGPCGELLLDPRFLNPCFCRSGTTSPASISPQSDTVPDSSFPPEDEMKEPIDAPLKEKILIDAAITANRIIPVEVTPD